MSEIIQIIAEVINFISEIMKFISQLMILNFGRYIITT